jgi:hypothetical protein
MTEDLLVDLAIDAAPQLPPTASILGPTFDPLELADARPLPCSTAPRPGTSPTGATS